MIFCPICQKKNEGNQGEQIQCDCGTEFTWVKCKICDKNNFFSSRQFNNDIIYACAYESCKGAFVQISCDICTSHNLLQISSLRDLKNVLFRCQVCEIESKLSICQLSEITQNPDPIEYDLTSKICKLCNDKYQNIECPYCLQIIYVAGPELPDGSTIDCCECNQQFGIVKSICCQRLQKVKEYKNIHEPINCQKCNKDTSRILCPLCGYKNQCSKQQLLQVKNSKNPQIMCKQCKKKLQLTTNISTNQYKSQSIKPKLGKNYITDFNPKLQETQNLNLDKQQIIQKQLLPNEAEIPQTFIDQIQKFLQKSIDQDLIGFENHSGTCLLCNAKALKSSNPIIISCGHQSCCRQCIENMNESKICPECNQQFRWSINEVFDRNFEQEILDMIEREQNFFRLNIV